VGPYGSPHWHCHDHYQHGSQGTARSGTSAPMAEPNASAIGPQVHLLQIETNH
jgi:hypothetical protein